MPQLSFNPRRRIEISETRFPREGVDSMPLSVVMTCSHHFSHQENVDEETLRWTLLANGFV
jgi:hypothetical protein